MPAHRFPSSPPPSRRGSGREVRRAGPSRSLLPWILAFGPWFAVGLLAAGLWWGVGLSWARMTRDDHPATRQRWALVLDGWVPGAERARLGLDLLRQGRLDSLAISGAPTGPDLWGSTLVVRGLAPADSERSRMIELRHQGTSTRDEALVATAFFRSRGVDTVILVTSDYHSDRAASIFAKVGGGRPVYRVVPAREARLSDLASREARKAWLLEATKRVHWALWERWRTSPASDADSQAVPWSVASGAELGQSPLLACPPAPACPAPAPCPVVSDAIVSGCSSSIRQPVTPKPANTRARRP